MANDELLTMKTDTPVVVTHGAYGGYLGYFVCVYPYPDGDPLNPKAVINVANADGSEPKRIILQDYEFMVLKNTIIRSDCVVKETLCPNDKPVIKVNKFNEGDRVIIVRGTYRGRTVKIIRVIPITFDCRLYDYEVGPIPDHGTELNTTIPEEDLESWGTVDPPSIIDGFDVSRYLDLDTRKKIASQIYTDSVKAYVNEIIGRRTVGNISLTDLCLGKACDTMVAQLIDQIWPSFVTRIKEVVQDKVATPENDMSFNCMLSNSLINACDKYIFSHQDEMIALFRAQIEQAAKSISEKELAEIITKRVNIKGIIEQLNQPKTDQE